MLRQGKSGKCDGAGRSRGHSLVCRCYEGSCMGGAFQLVRKERDLGFAQRDGRAEAHACLNSYPRDVVSLVPLTVAHSVIFNDR
jgi:hypothetical protein